jgi:hypothetical protein
MRDVGALRGGEHLRDALIADMTIGLDFNDGWGVGGGVEPEFEAVVVGNGGAVPEYAAVEVYFDVGDWHGLMWWRTGGKVEGDAMSGAGEGHYKKNEKHQ